MAAGFMPTAVDDPGLSGRPCDLCGKPIEPGYRFYQRNSWKLLGHMTCVLDRPDDWDALPDR